MSVIRTIVPAVAALLLATTATAHAQKANDPVIGNWVLSVAKSKYASPADAPKSGTRMYEVVNGKLHSAGQSVRADGSVDKYEFTGAYDGKESPYMGSAGDHITMTSVNDRTINATLLNKGKVVQKTHREVSADGKTLTMTTTRYAADGKQSTSIAVYTRK